MEPDHVNVKNTIQQLDEKNYITFNDNEDQENIINQEMMMKLEEEEAAACKRMPYPPGYRFVPTDEELIVEYLIKKINNDPIPIDEISDVFIKETNPKTLSEKHPQLGENEWYFFTPRDKKYPNGSRPNRAAEGGYWKATGADRPIMSRGELVGYKKVLVFYEGKPPNGVKTSWIMHEYKVLHEQQQDKRIADHQTKPQHDHMRLDDWVLCRIYEKSSKARNKNGDGKKEEEEEKVDKIINPNAAESMSIHENHPRDPDPHNHENAVYIGNYPATAALVDNNNSIGSLAAAAQASTMMMMTEKLASVDNYDDVLDLCTDGLSDTFFGEPSSLINDHHPFQPTFDNGPLGEVLQQSFCGGTSSYLNQQQQQQDGDKFQLESGSQYHYNGTFQQQLSSHFDPWRFMANNIPPLKRPKH